MNIQIFKIAYFAAFILCFSLFPLSATDAKTQLKQAGIQKNAKNPPTEQEIQKAVQIMSGFRCFFQHNELLVKVKPKKAGEKPQQEMNPKFLEMTREMEKYEALLGKLELLDESQGQYFMDLLNTTVEKECGVKMSDSE